MIRLDDRERDDPEWRAWLEECRAHQNELDMAMERYDPDSGRPKPMILPRIYAKLKEKHFAADRPPFWGKCAYCDQRIRSSQPGDVEHFRPKNGVADAETNKTIKVRDGSRKHPGYFWLAYDWRNLLLACESCNRPHRRSQDERRIGKWDHFPLADESRRAEVPGEEVEEEALLINPLVENPAEHLAITPEGVLYAVDGSKRGQTCIDLLGLNERDLPDERSRVYQDTKMLAFAYFDALRDDNSSKIAEYRSKIEEVCRGSRPHAIAARLALHDAKMTIVQLLENLPG